MDSVDERQSAADSTRELVELGIVEADPLLAELDVIDEQE